MTASQSAMTSHSWIMLFTIGILIFLMNIDYTAVNLALLPIAQEIESNLNTLQWLLSGYVLIWAALVVPAGRFADIYGKKFSLILGVAIFSLGSLITAIGSDAYMLIVGRLIQGLGAAIFSSPAYGLIFSCVPTNKQGMAMGFVGGSAGFGLAIGPTLSSWIIKEIGWRWLFYINIPLGIIVMSILFLYATPEKKRKDAVTMDWVSVILLATGLGSFVFALNQIEVWGFYDSTLWSCALGGLCSLLIFFYRDQRQSLQVLPRTILQNKAFMSAVTAAFIMAYCFSLVMVMMGLYLQSTLRLSSTHTGYYFLALTIAVGILSPIGGKLADHVDIRITVMLGYILNILALVVFHFLEVDSSAFMVCTGLLLAGLGIGIGFPSLNTAMFRTLESTEINTGSGIFTMAMTLGNAVSIIASTSFLVLFGRPKLATLISEARPNLPLDQQQALINVLGKVERSPDQLKSFSKEEIPNFLSLIDQAFLYGFRVTLFIGIGLIIIAGFIFLKNYKSAKQGAAAAPAFL